MGIYILIFLYLLFLAYIYDVRGAHKGLSFHYKISCIILILVAGLRYRIGFDTINYMESFTSALSLRELVHGVEFTGDLLWVYMVALSKEICNDFFMVQLIQAIIVNCTVFWFVKRHSIKPFVSILLYFLLGWWNLCFEAMREAIAVAFFLFALDALLSGKGAKVYYLRVWPAIFAHTFGFVTLFFPLIKFLKTKKIVIFAGIFLMAMVFMVKDYMNDLLLLMEMTSDLASGKAAKYMDSDVYGVSNMSLGGLVSLFIGNILPALYIIILLARSQNKAVWNIIPFVLAYIFICVLKTQVPIFYRFLNYFEILVIVAFSNALYLERRRFRRRVAVMLVTLMVLVRMYSLTAYDVGTNVKAYNRYVPYNSIFQKDFNPKSEMIFNS